MNLRIKFSSKRSKRIFTGGGNTFLLVKTLHEENLMSVLAENVKSGKPYLGTSAGSNIGINMKLRTICQLYIRQVLIVWDWFRLISIHII